MLEVGRTDPRGPRERGSDLLPFKGAIAVSGSPVLPFPGCGLLVCETRVKPTQQSDKRDPAEPEMERAMSSVLTWCLLFPVSLHSARQLPAVLIGSGLA